MICQKEEWKNRCCCNCKWQRSISGHPWNKLEHHKTSITTVIGYGCTVPDMPSIVLFEFEHGMCEMWETK